MSQSSWLFAAAAALHPRPWNRVSQSPPREGGSWKRAAAVNRRAETGPRTQCRPVAAVSLFILLFCPPCCSSLRSQLTQQMFEGEMRMKAPSDAAAVSCFGALGLRFYSSFGSLFCSIQRGRMPFTTHHGPIRRHVVAAKSTLAHCAINRNGSCCRVSLSFQRFLLQQAMCAWEF